MLMRLWNWLNLKASPGERGCVHRGRAADERRQLSTLYLAEPDH
jgi:hypothetical protein